MPVSKSLIIALILFLIVAGIGIFSHPDYKKMLYKPKIIQERTVQECREIKNFNERSNCLIMSYTYSKDVNLCKEIQKFHPENFVHCYAQVAVNTNNPALCDELTIGWNQQCIWQYKAFLKIKEIQS